MSAHVPQTSLFISYLDLYRLIHVLFMCFIVICKPEVEVPPSCEMEHMHVIEDFDMTQFEGVWYFKARLRGGAEFESGKVMISAMDDRTMKAQFAFRA